MHSQNDKNTDYDDKSISLIIKEDETDYRLRAFQGRKRSFNGGQDPLRYLNKVK